MSLTIGFWTRIFVHYPLSPVVVRGWTPSESAGCQVSETERIGQIRKCMMKTDRLGIRSLHLLPCAWVASARGNRTFIGLRPGCNSPSLVGLTSTPLHKSFEAEITVLPGMYYGNTWPIARGGTRNVVGKECMNLIRGRLTPSAGLPFSSCRTGRLGRSLFRRSLRRAQTS